MNKHHKAEGVVCALWIISAFPVPNDAESTWALAGPVYNSSVSRNLPVTVKPSCCLCPLMLKTHQPFTMRPVGLKNQIFSYILLLFKYKCAHHIWPATSEWLDFLHFQSNGFCSVKLLYSFSPGTAHQTLIQGRSEGVRRGLSVSDAISDAGSTSPGLLQERWGPCHECF